MFSVSLTLALTSVHGKPGEVVVNEIHYQPPNRTRSEEFIELHNPGLVPVDLAGWRLGDGVEFIFPAGVRISGGGYVVVAQALSAFQARFGFKPLGPWVGSLKVSGETIQLKDESGSLVDEVSFESGFPWPTQPAGGGLLTTSGFSAELIHPSLDRSLGGSWRSSLPPGLAAPYVPTNSPLWRYRKGFNEASAPISAWRAQGFAEDTTWTTGRTSIGYGDNDDQTILSDMRGNYVSVFLRHEFTVPPGLTAAGLQLRLRVDDGCVVWINGTEVARPHMNPGSFAYDAENAAQDHEASPTSYEMFVLTNAATYLTEGTNVLAIQVFNLNLNNADLTLDAELKAGTANSPTPGRANSVFALNAPPAIRQVSHFPDQPASHQAVLITARITDPDGVAEVRLGYQVVSPGDYIRKQDPAYESPSNWVWVVMNDMGRVGDVTAGDSVFSASLPAELQAHRRLIRYRIQASDQSSPSLSVTVPYPDDDSPNFAYFVYDGVPAWSGAIKPTAPNQTPLLRFPETVMRSLPAYHLVANSSDVIKTQYDPAFGEATMIGTLVIEGKVYDHIEYHVRGRNSTYVSGKNKWRFRANRAHKFAVRNDYGHRYSEDWDEINLEACSSPWGAVNRGMAGVEEAVSLRAYQLAGVAAPNAHYFQLRVIDGALEASPVSQYEGDLWGLYLAKETPDGSFLDERGLADGSVFFIEGNAPNKKHQGPTQPENDSDWTEFLANVLSRTANTVANQEWWRTHLYLPTFYSGRAIDRLVGNVDLREGANYYFYHHPDGRWHYVPWDLDLMFIPTLMNSGTIDQKNCLLMSPLKIEFANRCREILDLLASDVSTNGGQIGQLIDEYAQMVNPTGQTYTWADIDECLWNWHPRSEGSGANTGFTSHKGNFYRTPFVDERGGISWVRILTNAVNGRGNHEAFVRHMVDYSSDTFPIGRSWAINNGNPRGYGYKFVEQEARDTGVPVRPTIRYDGSPGFPANDLRFSSSAFQSNGMGGIRLGATQWRLGEISAPGIPLYNPTRPRIYEIESVWTSPELSNAVLDVRFPLSVIQPGHTYRARVRQRDLNGRWSRWSEGIQFVPAPSAEERDFRNLVLAEIMYHPPPATETEQADGFEGEDFEFIRCLNVGDLPLDLTDVRITKGIAFTFPSGFILEPSSSAYVVRNTLAFLLRYGPGKRIAGAYGPGNLSNSGESLELSYGTTPFLSEFTYGDSAPWPALADGAGYSLQLVTPESRPNHSVPGSWRAGIGWASWSAVHRGISDPLSDADGDGLTALMEYILGLDPLVTSPSPALALEVSISEGRILWSCRRSSAVSDVHLSLELSFDLRVWGGQAEFLSSTSHGDGTLTEVWRSTLPAVGGHQFGRLRAILEGR